MSSDKKPKPTLRDIPLFSELSIEQLREISALSEIRSCKRKERLFTENEQYKGFYILLKGTIKVYKITDSGREAVMHLLKPISSFGDIPLFDGKDYPVNAEATEESLVLFVSKDGFISLLRKNPEIALKMLGGFAKRLKKLVGQVEDLTTRDIRLRLAKYLLEEIKNAGTENLPEPVVTLTLPKSALASYLGTITETLSRTFKKLQEDGIIKVRNNKIIVINCPALKELAKH
ncbi:MAG: hypothetical protein AMXMBFR48_09860 [Ignavibacteriales bacterium]